MNAGDGTARQKDLKQGVFREDVEDAEDRE